VNCSILLKQSGKQTSSHIFYLNKSNRHFNLT